MAPSLYLPVQDKILLLLPQPLVLSLPLALPPPLIIQLLLLPLLLLLLLLLLIIIIIIITRDAFAAVKSALNDP